MGFSLPKSGLLLLMLVLLLIAFSIRTAVFLPNFIRLNKYLKSEICRAENHEERNHWKRARKHLFLCFFPFINVNNVESHSHKRKRK